MVGGLDLAVSPSSLEALLGAGRPRAYRSGEVVFHQGDASDRLYLLRAGRVAVRASSPDGDLVTLGLLTAPDEFGEVGLLRDDHHHTATVVALGDVSVVTVPADRFHELRAAHPDLTEWLLRVLVGRLEHTSDLLTDALFVEADVRVARRLLDSCRAFAGETSSVPISQEDLAAMAGVSRPTANRALRRLAAAGVVRLGRRHIEVCDLDGLRAAAR
jgi:CRP/FNR family transcriptional regulator, cyclic AMP receptor protein